MHIELKIKYDRTIRDTNSEKEMNKLIDLFKTKYTVDVDEIEQDEKFLLYGFYIIEKDQQEEYQQQIKKRQWQFFRKPIQHEAYDKAPFEE